MIITSDRKRKPLINKKAMSVGYALRADPFEPPKAYGMLRPYILVSSLHTLQDGSRELVTVYLSAKEVHEVIEYANKYKVNLESSDN